MNSCIFTPPNFTCISALVHSYELYIRWCIDHPGTWLQIVLKAALIWKTLTFLIHAHRPFLNYILAGRLAVLRSGSQTSNENQVSSLIVWRPLQKNKTISFLWLNEGGHYFLPFTLMLLVVSGCLIVTQVMDRTIVSTWIGKNTELYILFSLEESRGTKRAIQHFVKKKKQNSNFTDKQFRLLLWKFTILDQSISNFSDSTDTCLSPFKTG